MGGVACEVDQDVNAIGSNLGSQTIIGQASTGMPMRKKVAHAVGRSIFVNVRVVSVQNQV